ncbi:MAG: PqqD family protein [Candidatus Bathyarchaeia archaeon]
MKDKIKLSHVIIPKPHIIARKEKNCYLLVNRENGAILAVNDVGMDMWHQLFNKMTVGELIQKIMEKYNVKFELSKKETIKFIENLLKNEFANVSDSEAS